MVDNKETQKAESLGEFLLRHRREKKLQLENVLAETKIPPKALRAMEGDRYEDLPADAFARGFYRLLAKALELDEQEILKRYSEERHKKSRSNKMSFPRKRERQVNTMAARRSMELGPGLGISLILLVVIIAFLCWHFSWNPATFLSEKLRNLQKPATSEVQQQNTSGNLTELTPDTKYFLLVDFLTDTTATISIDNDIPENETFPKGASRSWQAQETITMILPESARVTVLLNGSQVDMPAPEGGYITFDLP